MNRLQLLAAACTFALPAFVFSGQAVAKDSIYFSAPIVGGTQSVSLAETVRAYRNDAARHVYDAYASRIFHGRLPPLIHAVVVVETTIDEHGRPSRVEVVRGPSHAPDVTEAVVAMIRGAGPLPTPSKLGQQVRFIETWLVHKDGRFQLDALTEGQD